MARIYTHYLASVAMTGGLLVKFERVMRPVDNYRLAQTPGATHEIEFKAVDADGEMKYFGSVRRYRLDGETSFHVEMNGRRGDRQAFRIHDGHKLALRSEIVRFAKRLIAAWAMGNPTYEQQRHMTFDTGSECLIHVEADSGLIDPVGEMRGTGILVADVAAEPIREAVGHIEQLETGAIDVKLSWSRAMPMLIALIENGTETGKAEAKRELMELAAKLDAANEGSN